MVDNVASTYSQENAKEAFWRWLTKGGTQDPGTTAPSISGGGASKGTPALTLGTTNAAGSASTFVATDATIAEFDATVPTSSAEGDAAAAGSAGKAARRDHLHGREAFGTTAAAVGTSAGGSATTPSKSDHVHATGAGTPSTQAFGDAAATGAGPAAAMTDHKHAMMKPKIPSGLSRLISGDKTVNGTSWANFDTSTDITLAAVAGDVIEAGLNFTFKNEAVTCFLDIVTVVSAAPVNSLSCAGAPNNTYNGIPNCSTQGSVFAGVGGSVQYALQAGDVSGGNVVLRVRVRTGTAANKSIFASAGNEFHFEAKNLGQ